MSDPSAEVRIRLVVDDASAAITEHIKSSLAGVEAATNRATAAGERHGARVGGAFLDLGSKARAYTNQVAAGVVTGELFLHAFEAGYEKLKSVVHDATDFIKDSVAAAQEGKREVGELSKSLLMMSPGASMGASKNMAKLLHDDFQQLAIQTGASSASMMDAFETIAERSNKSVTQVKALTEAMAVAGRGVTGGIGALAEGFAAIETGVVRAKNPVVQLITQSGLLHGTAKQVAAEMQKMTIDKQMALGEQAVEKMAAKLKGAPLGFNAIKNSMQEMKKEMMEVLGAPILEKLSAIAGSVRNFFAQHSDEMVEVARHLGNLVADYAQRATNYFAQMVGITDLASKDVGEKLIEAIDTAAMKIDETLASAQTVYEYISGTIGVITDNFKFWGDVLMKLFDAIVSAAKKMKDMVVMGFGGSLTPDEPAGAKNATLTTEDAHAALLHKQALKLAGDVGQPLEKINEKIIEFKTAMQARGMNDAEWTEINRGFQSAYDAAHTQAKAFDDAATAMDPNAWITAYNLAKKTHNEALMKHGEEVLAQSVALQSVFGDAAKNIDGGYAELASHLAKLPGGGMLASDLKARAASDFSIFNGKGAGAGITMNGGQTFQIKQDFRDQDPDRVFIVFKQDISKAAAARTQSRMSGVFGS